MEQYMTIAWIVGIGALMYFMVIRPQRVQQKQKDEMMGNLKKGDRIVTVGGIYGIVRAIKEDRVTLEIASEIYVQFSKMAVASVLRKEDKVSKAPEPETLLDADDDEEDDDGGQERDNG